MFLITPSVNFHKAFVKAAGQTKKCYNTYFCEWHVSQDEHIHFESTHSQWRTKQGEGHSSENMGQGFIKWKISLNQDNEIMHR